MKDKMKLTARFLSILFAASLFIACSKDGEIGPQGPKGEQGQVGAEGPAGQDGEQGEPGTANVIYSDWLDAKPYVFDEPGYSYVDKDAPEITLEIRPDHIYVHIFFG